MRKALLMGLPLAALAVVQGVAQTRSISGRVTDRTTGEGLPGVTVLLKGTTNGVSTNSDGSFTLPVPATGGTLSFSSVGFIALEQVVGTDNTINVALAADTKTLSEVVVTGYGTQERRDLTGSISTVKGEAIANLATPSFAQQLAGRSAGVNVQTPSGLLGQQPRIQIRGTNSITSGTYPLVVVDGQPIFTGNTSAFANGSNPLADINPADIESYEVLKDGSATAIYGSRAANGVILITTKRGREGKASVTYDTYVGVAKTLKRYDVLGANDFIAISNEKDRNAGGNGTIAAPFLDASGNAVSTDWQDQVFRTGFQQNHVLSVSGATPKTNYYFSGGFTDQTGVVKSNELQRFSFRSNVDTEVKKWLRVGLNLGLTRTRTFGLNTSVNGLSGNVTSALSLFPNVPARNEDGTPYVNAAGIIGQGNNTSGIAFNYPNILFPLENNVYRSASYRILGSGYLEVEPVKNVRLRTTLSTDSQLQDDFQFLDPRQGDGRGTNGSVYQLFGPSIRWNWANTATYANVIGEDHKINAVVGAEYQKTTSSYFNANGTGISDLTLGRNGIISSTLATPTIGGDFSENGLQSYFGRLNYSLKDRYLLSFTLRSDALSSLPEANRRGLFPGGSVGWRISEEPFFKGSGVSSIWTDFKLRASYALVGNVSLGSDFPYVGAYGPAQYASQAGIGYARFGNDQLKWETSKKTDFGVDLGFFGGRINLNADYYNNDVDDIILNVRTPLSLGVPSNLYRDNVGSLYNRGFEFTLTTENIRKENFSWSTNFNLSTNKNKVTSLNPDDNNADIIETYNITRVGESVGALFGYDFQGVNQANGNPIYRKGDENGTLVQGSTAGSGATQGRYYLYDPNNPSAALVAANERTLTVADKKVLGQTNPKVFGGFGNTVSFMGFDLDVFLRYSFGNKIMNVSRQQLLRTDFLNNGAEILNRWQSPENPGDGQTPRIVSGTSAFVNQDNNASTRFVESGNFVRLQNISLGYTIPTRYITPLNLSRVRLFVQAQNVATITKYKGVDPEVNTNATSNTQAGVDYNSNPQQRVFTGGVNVAF